MGELVTVAEAGFLVRKNERAVRWHIGKGHLTPQAGDDGHARLDTDELATVRGWRVDAARLAELLAHEERTAEALAERVERLERRVDRLEKLLGKSGALTGAPDGLAADSLLGMADYDALATGGHRSASGDVSRAETHRAYSRRPAPTLRLSSTLPAGLVSVTAFAGLHNVPRSTVTTGIQSGRLTAIEGDWKQGRSTVLWALDDEGRRTFYALWGDRDDFQRCEDCPHSRDQATRD